MTATRRRVHPARVTAAAVAAALALGACGADDEAATSTAAQTTTTAATSTAATTTAPAALRVVDATAPATVPEATVGAVFLVVENPTAEPDALVAASVDASVARSVQLQQQADTPAGDEHASARAPVAVLAHGSQVRRLEVPAGSTVTFDHGTGHIVLVGLARPLVVGETFPMVLEFEKAGAATISVTVREG